MNVLPPAPPAPPATPPSTGRSADPTLGFAFRLIVIGLPIAGLLSATHSRGLASIVAAVAAFVVLLQFPRPTAARLLGVTLVLAPDAVVVGQLGGSPVSLREVAFIGFYLAIVLALLRGRLRMRTPAPLLMTVLVAAGILGALDNDRPKSLLEFAVLIVLPPVAGAVLSTSRETAVDFLRGLTAGTIVLLGVAFTEALTGTNFLVSSTAAGSFVRSGHIRANAGWDYPTMLSAFLCLTGFFVIEALRRRWGLVGLVVGGTAVTAGVITTQTRSGLLGLVVGAVAYLLLQRRASQGLAVIVGLVGVTGLLMVLPGAAPASFRDFVSQSFTAGSSANANVLYRKELYTAAGRAMAEHPWFGYGFGSGKSVATNALHTYFGTLTDLASLPVSLAVQLGYVGALAIGLFLLGAFVRLARTRDLPERLPLAAGILGCAAAMTGVPVSPPLTWMLLLAGLGWGLVQTQRDAARPRSTTDAGEPGAEPPPRPLTTGRHQQVLRVGAVPPA